MGQNWIITKMFRFEASHQLVHHDGKCARLHGHSWVCKISLSGDSLVKEGPKKNMVVDFGDVSKAVQPLIADFLDHHHLNETLGTDSPTSEFVAKWIYDRLAPVLLGLEAVQVDETCTSACTYTHRQEPSQ